MIIMGIDTSGSFGGAALVSEQGLVAEYLLQIHRGHSELIVPTIERVLSDSGIALEDLTAFAVVTGPGSFTGLRIGLATVKGFAYALNKPIIPVTAMEALAWQHRTYPQLVYPIIDARRQEVFTQAFRSGESVAEAVNCKVSDLVEMLNSLSEPVLFTGPGVTAHRQQLSEVKHAIFAPDQDLQLRPSSAAALGLERFKQGKTQSWYDVLPYYMRKSSAEYQFNPTEK